MLGAIIGDMVGSIYEYTHPRTKNINMFDMEMRMTDDSYLTIAVAKALMNNYPIDYSKEGLEKIKIDLKVEFVNAVYRNPVAGYGGMFYSWAMDAKHNKSVEPYYSYGNGSAMRISPVGWIAKTEEELKLLSKTVTEITHNHPEGIKGAEAVALCIFMALHGSSREEIKNRMINEYYPEIANYNLDYLMENMHDSCSCQDTVPPAIYCFLISESLEDAIKNCIAVGGDCDTTAAIAGSIAEAFYSKDKLSKFEEKFLYLKIEPYVEKLTKSFHKKIGSTKFN